MVNYLMNIVRPSLGTTIDETTEPRQRLVNREGEKVVIGKKEEEIGVSNHTSTIEKPC